MGDVADILGINASSSSSRPQTSKASTVTRKKPVGMSREVFALLDHAESSHHQSGKGDGFPALVPSKLKQTGVSSGPLKQKRLTKANKWVHTPFQNNARTQDQLELKHWMKATTLASIEQAPNGYQYPFARFNVQADVFQYSDQEYAQVQAKLDNATSWTKAETDRLLQLCKRYDLRWFVIADRFNSGQQKNPKQVDDLKHRYFTFAQHLRALKPETPTQPGLKAIPENYTFDYQHEVKRKQQLQVQFTRSNEEEKEIARLKTEIRQLDVQLRKSNSRTDSRKKKQAALMHVQVKRKISPGVYLRSRTQALPGAPKALSERFLNKVQAILTELGVPERPLPTATVSDLYDRVRQDLVKLISLQKTTARKEKEVFVLQEKLKSILDPSYVPQKPTPVVSSPVIKVEPGVKKTATTTAPKPSSAGKGQRAATKRKSPMVSAGTGKKLKKQ